MGKFILCTSKQAEIPYVFPVSEIRLYTIEELCYYIYNNIYEITKESFDESLVQWLRDQLSMKVIAEKLDTMLTIHSSLKDIVISLLCSCDYYTELEIKSLLQTIAKIEHMPFHGRQKQKADNYLKYQKYTRAKREYDRILTGGYAVNLTPEEYGNILHNRSIACFYMGLYQEAMDGWKDAYSRNNNNATLYQYLLSLLLNNEKKEFEQEIKQYNVSPDIVEHLRKQLAQAYIAAKETSEYQKVINVIKYSNEEEALTYSKKKIATWKNQFRNGE